MTDWANWLDTENAINDAVAGILGDLADRIDNGASVSAALREQATYLVRPRIPYCSCGCS